MAPRKPGYGTGYDRTRKAMLAESPWCAHHLARGMRVPATEADHQPPLSLHRHVDGDRVLCAGAVVLRVRAAPGRLLGGARRRQAGAWSVVEPEGFGPRGPVWDVPWLQGCGGCRRMRRGRG